MTFFDWMKIRKPSTAGSPQIESEAGEDQTTMPTEKEIFGSPSLLAEWVDRWFLKARPVEEDFDLLPDDATRKNLNITVEQRERCVREYSVLRIAGVSSFIKQYYSDRFWMAFSSSIVPFLVKHIYGRSDDQRATEVAEAIEAYVNGLASKDVDLCSNTYLKRVYDDSDHYLRMKAVGIGFISCDHISSHYEVFRDAHCRVTQGMSYDAFKTLSNALEKVQAEKVQQNTSADAAKSRS